MDESNLRLVGMESAPRRVQIMANGEMGMLLFVFTEIMLFAGFISAFTIIRASAMVWPPPGQPRLPLEETILNTAALVASGVALIVAQRVFKRHRALARWPLFVAIGLGGAFVVLQGMEWVSMLTAGLTLTSSVLGSFFYTIIGLHALHALVALGLLVRACLRLLEGRLRSDQLATPAILWYFVVGVWPVIFYRVYP
jgi:heme/copper-type cytochrome/quinol oxidase subunit 3